MGVGTATIRRIEKSQAMTGYASTLARIQAAFEKAGVEFIDDDEKGGLGLRLVKRKQSDDTAFHLRQMLADETQMTKEQPNIFARRATALRCVQSRTDHLLG